MRLWLEASRTAAGALAAIFALATLAPGCGDGLLGEDGIRALTGHDDLQLPVDPAWLVRWMRDGEYVDSFHEAYPDQVFPSYAESEGTWYNYLNYVEVDAPDVHAPPPEAIRSGPHYSYAVGVPLLLDDVDGDGDHVPPTEHDPGELWGVTPESAFLFVEGDLDAFWAEQPVSLHAELWWEDEHAEPLVIEEGTQKVWVDMDLLASWDWFEEWFEEWEEQGEPPPEGPMEMALLVPDDPDVLSSDHEGAFLVAVARIVDSSFPGGVGAFLGEAWYTWFHDPEGGDDG